MTPTYSINEIPVNPYDETPYASYPYPMSSPAHLKTIGTLFGMNPPPLENARILELGCSVGGNIIPVASMYPDSRCVAVDLSLVQINMAREQIKAMALNNMEFHHMSIMDVSKSTLGEFDYIIIHGVFSWVPDEVRSKIFDICGDMLRTNGIAYISYNTLPGWNTIKSIREMMLYHAVFFNSIDDKINQAKAFLEFVKDSLSGVDSPHAKLVEQEYEIIKKAPDYYVWHEYMAKDNKQFYFHEFIAEAVKRGLQYLGDAVLPSMSIANRPQKEIDKLQSLDTVRTEQYMDFITNRKFRHTLLCREEIGLSRKIDINKIHDFYISLILFPEKDIKDVDIKNTEETLKFYLDPAKKATCISSSSPAIKAVFYTWIKNSNYPMKIEEIVALASKDFPDVSKDLMISELVQIGLSLVFSDKLSAGIFISSEKPRYIQTISEKPVADKLVRYQAEKSVGLTATNRKHGNILIDHLDKFILRYLDGTNNKEQILDKLMEHFRKDDYSITLDSTNKKITDENEARFEIGRVLSEKMNTYTRSALLIG